MLIDVRIICAYDALGVAQQFQRLLAAEGHNVELNYGRPSLAFIPISRARREAVIVIWSERAQNALYPLQWAQATEPTRLIELAFCKEWPPVQGRARLIEFSVWNGRRGSASWRGLQERLRAIAKSLEPPKPQPRGAAFALVGASLVAAGAAIWARTQANHAPLEAAPETSLTATLEETRIDENARGGPLGDPISLSEPETYTPTIEFRPRFPRSALADIRPVTHIATAPHFAPAMDFSEPSLLERLFDRDAAP